MEFRPETTSLAESLRDFTSISRFPTHPSSLSSISLLQEQNTRNHLIQSVFSFQLNVYRFLFLFSFSLFPFFSLLFAFFIGFFVIFISQLMAFSVLMFLVYPPHSLCSPLFVICYVSSFLFPFPFICPSLSPSLFIFISISIFVFPFRGSHEIFMQFYPLFSAFPLSNLLLCPQSEQFSRLYPNFFFPPGLSLATSFLMALYCWVRFFLGECYPRFQQPQVVFKFIFFQLLLTITRCHWHAPQIRLIPSL